jgi:hypothetical protein
MKPLTNIPKRVGAVLGFLLLAALMGILIAQESVSSLAAPLPTAPPPTVESLATPFGATPFGATPFGAVPLDPNMPHREISGDGKSPDISFIDSSNATCSRPVPGTGACYIQWNYLYVTAASSSYIISMTVAIDNHIRAYHAGFFQTSMYIPSGMTAPGYRVTCGAPGSSGMAEWGRTYSYAIRARETSGLSAANYGSVLCPADTVRVFLPFIKK